jgi:hypothetical protein
MEPATGHRATAAEAAAASAEVCAADATAAEVRTATATAVATTTAAATTTTTSATSATACSASDTLSRAEGDRHDAQPSSHPDPQGALLGRSHPTHPLEGSRPRCQAEPEARREQAPRLPGPADSRPEVRTSNRWEAPDTRAPPISNDS